jgi:hypothetical protein
MIEHYSIPVKLIQKKEQHFNSDVLTFTGPLHLSRLVIDYHQDDYN